jgi:hypothetical protein
MNVRFIVLALCVVLIGRGNHKRMVATETTAALIYRTQPVVE